MVRAHSMRSAVVTSIIALLVLAVAAPATGLAQPGAPATTVQQLAVAHAQTATTDLRVVTAPLVRGTYSATTPEEISARHAAERAAQKRDAEERAARERAAQHTATQNPAAAATPKRQPVLASGAGEIRYPLPHGSYRVSRTLTATHDGADMAAGEGTPIFAVSAGTVRASANNIGGYGNAVIIDHVIGGKRVSTLYGHMVYGSRLPKVGEHVAAGQHIGGVGNTGRSRGDHLHIEIRVNGSLVEPVGWLAANAR